MLLIVQLKVQQDSLMTFFTPTSIVSHTFLALLYWILSCIFILHVVCYLAMVGDVS